jgi:hypothetical protein
MMREKYNALSFSICPPLQVLNLALNTGTDSRAIFLFLINNDFREGREKNINTIIKRQFSADAMFEKYVRVCSANQAEANV